MLEMYAAGTFGFDVTDPRNQFNERALHEARIATEFRGYAQAAPHTSGLLERVRAAMTGAKASNTPEPCPAPPENHPTRAQIGPSFCIWPRSQERPT